MSDIIANYKFLRSGSIEVYPSGFRSAGYEKAKLSTEENLLKLRGKSIHSKNNKLCFKDSENNLWICIAGYVFKISDYTLVEGIASDDTDKYLCAKIVLKKIDNIVGKVLSRIDDDEIPGSGYVLDVDESAPGEDPTLSVNNSYFHGLGFYFSDVTPEDEYELAVAKGSVIESKLSLNSDEIRDLTSGKAISEDFNSEKISTENLDVDEVKINNKISLQNSLHSIDADGSVNVKSVTVKDLNKSASAKLTIEEQDAEHDFSQLEVDQVNTDVEIIGSDNSSGELKIIEAGGGSILHVDPAYEDTDVKISGNADTIELSARNGSSVALDYFNGISMEAKNGAVSINSHDGVHIDTPITKISSKAEIDNIEITSSDSDNNIELSNGSASLNIQNSSVEISDTFTNTASFSNNAAFQNINNFDNEVNTSFSNNNVSIGSLVDINKKITLNAPLTIGNDASTGTIKITTATDNNNSNIICPDNGTSTLIKDIATEDIESAHIQKLSNGSIKNNWLGIATDASAGTLVKRASNDNNYTKFKKVEVENLKVTGELINSGSSSSSVKVSGLELAGSGGNISIIAVDSSDAEHAAISITNDKLLKIEDNVSIKNPVIINNPLTVKSATIIETAGGSKNKLNITSGSNNSLVIFDSGELNLPTNTTSEQESVWAQKASGTDSWTNSWIKVSENADANSIVKRDSNGGIKANNVLFNEIRGKSHDWYIDSDGQFYGYNADFSNKLTVKSATMEELEIEVNGSRLVQINNLGAISTKGQITADQGIIATGIQVKADEKHSGNLSTAGSITCGTSMSSSSVYTDYFRCNGTVEVYSSDSATTPSFRIDAGGNITKCNTIKSNGITCSSVSATGQISANSFNATSDKRLKENIKLKSFKKSILDLPIYEFDFIDGKKNNIGCLAQDLKEICPEIVHENDDGYLSIEETKLVYLLIDEVKKLKDEIYRIKKGK